MTVLAALLLAVPVAFGLVRMVTTGSDFRYLVVALAATLGALVVFARSKAISLRTLGLGAGLAAALFAAVASVLLGGRSAVSIGVVSLGFAACSAAGVVLFARARR
jgi:hypothetical protein